MTEQDLVHELGESGRGELTGRHVHGEQEGRLYQSGPRPCGGLRHGAVEHPRTQRLDQAGFLGERHERRRHQQAVGTMPPAHQRLDADHTAAVESEGRLVVQRQLVVAQRSAQVVLAFEARDDPIVDVGLEHRCRPAPALLRLGERRVGLRQQLIDAFTFAGRSPGDADARRDVDLPTGDRERLRHGVRHALRHHLGRIGRQALHDQDGELVASETGENVVAVEQVANPLRERTQQLIPDVVAIAVVDELEAIDVDQQHRDGTVASAQRL